MDECYLMEETLSYAKRNLFCHNFRYDLAYHHSVATNENIKERGRGKEKQEGEKERRG